MFAATSTKYVTSTYNTSPFSGLSDGAGIWMIVAFVLAIIGGILIHFLFIKGKFQTKNKFLLWLKDFLEFKTMWIETIAKIFYYIITTYIILASFALISSSFLNFILTLVLGPIVVRVIYESIIMLIMIWRNTADIAKNTKK